MVFIAVLLLRLAALPVLPVPEPEIHDEFGYLLGAETLASGHLVGPTHPFWPHFETIHVSWVPAHVQAHPIGPSIFMAGGIVLFGHPWAGVLFMVAFLCGALTWMLYGWLPPRWALLGGLLAVLRFGIFGYWANSYWGGPLAAGAGALVLGALPRILRHGRARDAALLALGLLLLANSRPFEGFVLSLPVAAVLGYWLLRRRGPALRRALGRVVLVTGLILLAGGGAMAVYFRAATGSPFVMPFQHNRDTYAIARHFPWQQPYPAPVYRHEVMSRFYDGWEGDYYRQIRAEWSLWRYAARTVSRLWTALGIGGPMILGALLLLPLLVLGPRVRLALLWLVLLAVVASAYWLLAIQAGVGVLLVARRRRFRLLGLFLGTVLVGLSLEVYFLQHYAAPLAAVVFALGLAAARRLWPLRWRGRSVGRGLLATAVAAYALLLARGLLLPGGLPTCVSSELPPTSCVPEQDLGLERAALMEQLKETPGRDLVFVQYSPTHNIHREWVYNEPDVDAAEVVFARPMGEAEDRALREYFRGYRVWLLQPDPWPVRLRPLDGEGPLERLPDSAGVPATLGQGP